MTIAINCPNKSIQDFSHYIISYSFAFSKHGSRKIRNRCSGWLQCRTVISTCRGGVQNLFSLPILTNCKPDEIILSLVSQPRETANSWGLIKWCSKLLLDFLAIWAYIYNKSKVQILSSFIELMQPCQRCALHHVVGEAVTMASWDKGMIRHYWIRLVPKSVKQPAIISIHETILDN